MDDTKKIQLFLLTVIVSFATIWWLMPAFFNIWKETATVKDTYAIGLTFGIILGFSWTTLVWCWTKS